MHDKSPSYLGPTAEAAEYLHQSPRTLIRWRGQRKGPPFVYAGQRVLYRKSDLDAYLDQHRVVPIRERDVQ